MRIFLIYLFCIFPISVHANEILFKSSVGLILLDWYQTKQFVAQGVEETNPVLGKHPTQAEIDTKIGIGLLLYILAYNRLDEDKKLLLSFLVFTGEFIAVSNTIHFGYGAKF